MGVLKKGNRSLKWEASKKYHAYVKRHGLLQFLHVFQQRKDEKGVEFLWGDEVEHIVTVVKNDQVKLNLRAEEVMYQLQDEMEKIQDENIRSGTFHAEYGCFMIETTPSRPYGGLTTDLRLVQRNMTLRRTLIQDHLLPDERVMNISAFPMMGAYPGFTHPDGGPVEGPIIRSKYIPDGVINSHPRFATLTRNIRRRRGQTVCIRMPLFRDKNTPEFQDLEEGDGTSQEAKPNSSEEEEEEKSCDCGEECVCCHRTDPEYCIQCPGPQEQMYAGRPAIHMDAMAFGMGCCCLQTTFQARSMPESRYLFDQLAVLAPIMLAATAATPFLKGRIADTDARWNVIAQAVDDRQVEELGLKEHLCSDHLTDTPEMLAQEAKEEAEEEEAFRLKLERRKAREEARAKGLPVEETSDEDDEDEGEDELVEFEIPEEFEHEIGEETGPKIRLYKSRYDSISCYISQSPRLRKEYNDIPAGINPEAYKMLNEAGVDHLLARHMAHLWTRDPLVIFEDRLFEEKDEESFFHFDNIQSTNWQTVRWKPPVPGQSGWKVEFRTMEVQLTDFENAAYTCFVALLSRAILLFDLNLYIPLSKVDENMQIAHRRDAVRKEKFYFRQCIDPSKDGKDGEDRDVDAEYRLMSLEEIICGKKDGFPGLINFVQAYLDVIKCDAKTRELMNRYMKLIGDRASGKLLTTATWLRECVMQHPDYKQDSVLPESAAYEVLEMCHKITNGEMEAPQLLGDLLTDADMQRSHKEGQSGADSESGRYLRGASFRVDLENPQSFAEFRQVLSRNKIDMCKGGPVRPSASAVAQEVVPPVPEE